MSILDAIATNALGELAKHPELVGAINEALAQGLTGDALVRLIKAEMTRASDEAMDVSLALLDGK